MINVFLFSFAVTKRKITFAIPRRLELQREHWQTENISIGEQHQSMRNMLCRLIDNLISCFSIRLSGEDAMVCYEYAPVIRRNQLCRKSLAQSKWNYKYERNLVYIHEKCGIWLNRGFFLRFKYFTDGTHVARNRKIKSTKVCSKTFRKDARSRNMVG